LEAKKQSEGGYRFNIGYPDSLDWFRGARIRAVEAGLLPRVTVTVTFSSNLSDPRDDPPERKQAGDGEG